MQSGIPENPQGKRIVLYRRSTSTNSESDLELITLRDISSLEEISSINMNMSEIPSEKFRQCDANRSETTDDAGQVTEVTEEHMRTNVEPSIGPGLKR